jgi:hypothetical protein
VFLFSLLQPYQTTFFSEYKASNLQKTLQLAQWMESVLQKAKNDGEIPSTKPLIPTLGFLALLSAEE